MFMTHVCLYDMWIFQTCLNIQNEIVTLSDILSSCDIYGDREECRELFATRMFSIQLSPVQEDYQYYT